MNSGLLVACIVLAFQKSSALAAAYGIAVTGTMGITTIVYYVVVRKTWGWSRWRALPLAGLFLAFFTAQKGVFAFISQNARPATAYFGLPPNRVVELGMQVDF